LIESSVADGIYIVRTNYVLKEKSTGNLYGRGGEQFYGSYYTIGYKLPTGIVCDRHAQTPWVRDQEYDKYRNNEKYEPVLTDSFSITGIMNEKKVQSLPTTQFRIISNTDIGLFSSLFSNDEFFSVNAKDLGEQTGWIVWLSSTTNDFHAKGAKLNLTSSNKLLNITDSTKIKIETPVYSERIVGGIFIIPEFVGVGKIRLNLRGLIMKEEEQWFLYPANKNWKLCNNSRIDVSPAEVTNQVDIEELTPIKEKTTSKKKKKSKK